MEIVKYSGPKVNNGLEIAVSKTGKTATQEESMDTEDVWPEDRKNPFMILPVIETVCSFLDYYDVKNVRMVCKEWNYAAAPFLRKLGRVSFAHPCPAGHPHSLLYFDSVVKHTTNIPFTAAQLTLLKMKGSPEPDPVLVNFFETIGKGFTDLSIIRTRYCSSLREFNMSAYLEPLSITKLNVGCETGWGTVLLQFSLDVLINVKYLKLRECKLLLTTDKRISPVAFELIHCTVVFPTDSGVINDFVDFSSMKRFIIVNYQTHKLKLDLTGNFELDTVDLTGVAIYNWKFSNWKVSTFNLSGIRERAPIIDESPIQIKAMKLLECSVFLPSIPRSVERLTILEPNQVLEFPSLHLPNLKRLKVSPRDLERFKNCVSLTSLELFPSPGVRYIEVGWIPVSVKRIRITEAIEIVGEGSRQLDKLVFHEYSLKTLGKLIDYLSPETIIIRLFCYSRCRDDNYRDDEKEFLQALHRCKNLAIGPINWDHPGMFRSHRIAKLINKRSLYYIFDKTHGNAICKPKFDELMDLDM